MSNECKVSYSISTHGAQDLTYTYDPTGNITLLSDASNNSAPKVVAFTYDQYNRLTSASTTPASPVLFREAYTYNAIGNLITKTGVGTSTYASTNYANPHAPTTVGSLALTYDNNGSLTSFASTTYAYDYLSRLTSVSTPGTATSSYTYDSSGARVSQTILSTTTLYPSKFYSITSTTNGATTTATSTDYLYQGDTLLATIDQLFINGTATGTPTTRYIHPDHLGSTNLVTDVNANIVQALDYFPYGATRIASSTPGTDSKRKYISQFTDSTNLSYLNARY